MYLILDTVLFALCVVLSIAAFVLMLHVAVGAFWILGGAAWTVFRGLFLRGRNEQNGTAEGRSAGEGTRRGGQGRSCPSEAGNGIAGDAARGASLGASLGARP